MANGDNKNGNGGNLGFEAEMFKAADKHATVHSASRSDPGM